jgi:hypothetical protein
VLLLVWPPVNHMIFEGISTTPYVSGYSNTMTKLKSFAALIQPTVNNLTNLFYLQNSFGPLVPGGTYKLPSAIGSAAESVHPYYYQAGVGSYCGPLLSYWLVSHYLYSTYQSFVKLGFQGMSEKFYAPALGLTGAGGEYITQLGFGWTNGVSLLLLEKYKTILNWPLITAEVATNVTVLPNNTWIWIPPNK